LPSAFGSDTRVDEVGLVVHDAAGPRIAGIAHRAGEEDRSALAIRRLADGIEVQQELVGIVRVGS
jgi:hypothetical protein